VNSSQILTLHYKCIVNQYLQICTSVWYNTCMKIISRQAAKSKELKFYFTGKPCKNGHIEKRYTVSGHCPSCSLDSTRRFYTQNPSYSTSRRSRKCAELRIAVYNKLGGKCSRCNFSDARALQIDHVNGGGSKELKCTNQENYLQNVLRDSSDKYQLLCANCNWIKRFENERERGGAPKSVPALQGLKC
jgi:hypothetical protein